MLLVYGTEIMPTLLHGPLVYCSDVAEAIVKSQKWKSALTNYTRSQNGEMTSPFRKLIQRMPGTFIPVIVYLQLVFLKLLTVALLVSNNNYDINADVAEMVLNKCTTTNADRNIRPDSKDFAVTFNYEFLEDRDRAAELVMMT
jgi:hypothetical protein